MKAVTVQPGVAGSVRYEEVPEPDESTGSILVEAVAVGICGTDVEIASGAYGWAPPGRERLILGHESLGRVVDPGLNAGSLQKGDLIVGIVRRPDPVPCPNCAVGEWDMCRNGQYTERGIKQIDGFMSERWRIEPGLLHQAGPVTRPPRSADRADDRGGQGLGAGRGHASASVLGASPGAGHRRRPDRHARRPHRRPARARRPRPGPGHRGRQATTRPRRSAPPTTPGPSPTWASTPTSSSSAPGSAR